MNLAEHLRIRTPIVWINTTEPDRITEQIVEGSPKDVYRLDALLGLVVNRKGTWKQVLVEIPSQEPGEPPIETPTFDLSLSLQYVMENKGTYIVYFADKIVEDLLPFLAVITTKYRDSFFDDNDKTLPAQFVFVACNADIPPELGHNVAYIDAPLPSESELAEIAAHVYSGAHLDTEEEMDLTGIVRSGIGLNETEFIQSLLLSIDHKGKLDPAFVSEYKLDKIKQGGLLEIRRPTLTLDDIGGLDLAKALIEHVVWSWNNPGLADEFKVEPLRRVLMVGVPGTGKSAICEAAASSLGLELAKFGVSQMMDKFIGESERKMRAAFAQMNAMAPLVVWMDELGRDLSQGDYQGDGGTTSRVHGEFLTGIQELQRNIFLMAAANRIDSIAPEMLRADRFDKIMFVGFPTFEERVHIFRIHLGERQHNHNLDLLADASPSFTGAEIKALIRETRFTVSYGEKRHITDEDILAVMKTQHNRVWLKHRGMIIDMYRRAQEEWEWASSSQRDEAPEVISQNIDKQMSKTAGRQVMQGF